MRLQGLEEEVAGGELSGTGFEKPAILGISDSNVLQAAYNFTGQSASSNGVTMQQVFLQSIVTSEREFEALSTRLRGLCQERSRFCDFEVSMRIGQNETNASAGIYQQEQFRYPPVSLRLRRSLLSPQARPVIRYLGMVDSDKSVMRRNCLEIPIQGPVTNFLSDIGFDKEFAYIAEGHIYIRGRIKCLVYRVNDVQQYSNSNTLELIPKEWRPINPTTWLVELSGVGSAADESLNHELLEFSDLLRPVVQLNTIDYTKFSS